MRSLLPCIILAVVFFAPGTARSVEFDETQQIIREAMNRLSQEDPPIVGDPAAVAAELGTVEAVFEYVRDQIRYDAYGGRLRGPAGTLQSGAGNDVDQSELLAAMLLNIGEECRFARARCKLVSGESVDHVWVQLKTGEEWSDLDPTAEAFDQESSPSRRAATEEVIPKDLAHRARLEVKYRVKRAGKLEEISSLVTELDVAELYGRKLTLAHRWEGDRVDERYVVEAVQPILKLDDSLFCGTIISAEQERKAAAPSNRLGGIFDRLDSQPEPSETQTAPELEILSNWVDVQITSPGKPKDRFQYMVTDREAEPETNTTSLDALMAVQAFGFSPAMVTDQALREHMQTTAGDVEELTQALSRISRLELTSAGPAEAPSADDASTVNISLENGQRALASTVLMYYMLLSDQALETMNEEHDALAFHSMPRAIIASVRQHRGNMLYDLDLRRNQVGFVGLADSDPDQVKLMHYHRGVFESRLEGAVLKAFTGHTGITAADILIAAQEQEIQLIPLSRQNRQDMSSVQLTGSSRMLINAAVVNGRTVLAPEKPVVIEGEELFAWCEYDPKTGFLEGVFPSGKHQGMTEYISEEAVIQTLVSQGMSYLSSALVGYYFSIATGLGHFYACLLDLDNPNKVCFGQPDVCQPARADAVALCKAWKDAKQYFDFGSAAASTDLGGLIPWPDAWETLAGEPCDKGASAGLKWFGCGN